MLTEFSYKVKPCKYSGEILTPFVWLELKTIRDIYEPFEFLFDTGADFTSLPKHMATDLGLTLEESAQEIMYTANNEPMITYHSEVEVNLGKEEFKLPCVFTDKDDTPFLLGRVGFIEKFEMLLSAKNKNLTFDKE